MRTTTAYSERPTSQDVRLRRARGTAAKIIVAECERPGCVVSATFDDGVTFDDTRPDFCVMPGIFDEPPPHWRAVVRVLISSRVAQLSRSTPLHARSRQNEDLGKAYELALAVAKQNWNRPRIRARALATLQNERKTVDETLRRSAAALDALTEELLVRGTIRGDEVRALFAKGCQ